MALSFVRPMKIFNFQRNDQLWSHPLSFENLRFSKDKGWNDIALSVDRSASLIIPFTRRGIRGKDGTNIKGLINGSPIRDGPKQC